MNYNQAKTLFDKASSKENLSEKKKGWLDIAAFAWKINNEEVFNIAIEKVLED